MNAPAVASALLALMACSACSQLPGPSPQVGFAVETGSISCRVDGPARTIERNVYSGDAVVEAHAGGDMEVVLVDEVEPCMHVVVSQDGSPGGASLGPCPAVLAPGRAVASNALERYEARTWSDSQDVAHIRVGFVTYEAPHAKFGVAHEGRPTLIEHALVPPMGGEGGGESNPALAALGGDEPGFLLAWVEGDEVRVQPLAHGAEPVGPAIALDAGDVEQVGRPSVAFSAGGRGLVAFTARTETGNDALAVPIVCSR